MTSLYTNIPQDFAVKAVEKRYNLEPYIRILQDKLIGCVMLLMNSTCFTFDDEIYEQICDTPMDSPISPIIAFFVMKNLEENCLENSEIERIFYLRFVDDILTTVRKENIESIVNKFDLYHPKLRFTFETENQNRINFLELKII